MTKELSLFDTLLSTSTKSSGETKVSKEGSSLFDDLLKGATTQNQNLNQTTTSLNTQQGIANQQHTISNGVETIVKEGGDVKTNTLQSSQSSTISSTVAKNIVSDSIISKSDTILKNPEQVQTQTSNIQTTSADLSNQVVVKNLITDGVTENKIDLKTTDANETVTSKPKDVNSKNSINIDNKITESNKDGETLDVASKNGSQEVLSNTSSRTPSVLDKIQVDKKGNELTSVEKILNGSIKEIDGVLANSSEHKVVATSIGQPLLDETQQSKDGAEISTNGQTLKNLIDTKGTIGNKQSNITSDTVTTQMVTTEELSLDQGMHKDLFTSLITQAIGNASEKSQKIVETTTQPINLNNTVSDNMGQTKVVDKIDSIQQGTTPAQNDDILTTAIAVSNKNYTETKPQEVSKELDTSVNGNNKQLTQQDEVQVIDKKTNVNVVEASLSKDVPLSATENLSKTVVPSKDNVVEAVVKDVTTQNIICKSAEQVKEIGIEDKQPIENIKGNQPIITKEEPTQKVELVNAKNLQADITSNQEIKTNLTSENVKSDGSLNKQNAAVEFAKLNQNDTLKTADVVVDDTIKDVSKKTEQVTTKQNSSLLDKLIEDTLKVVARESSQVSDKVEIKNGQILENVKNQDNVQKTDIMENIYKSSVSKNISLAAMQNAIIAKETVKNGSSVQDIQKSADMLELNLEGIEEVKTQDTIVSDSKQRAVNIGRAFLEKDLLSKDVLSDKNLQNADIEHKQTSATDTKITTNNIIQKAVELTVNDVEVLTIQNRIIGARQQLSSMMSDVARAMYENYKPPHTAFRISLNPANLGSIAILIRSQRADNSLSISMNMSSSATLESMVANQNELRSALQKTFNDNSSFEFDFKLDPDASGSGFQNGNFGANEQNQETKDDERNTFVASSEIIEEIQEVQKSGTYF